MTTHRSLSRIYTDPINDNYAKLMKKYAQQFGKIRINQIICEKEILYEKIAS